MAPRAATRPVYKREKWIFRPPWLHFLEVVRVERGNGPLRIADSIWFWLVASNVLFFLVYLVWGVWNVLRVPVR